MQEDCRKSQTDHAGVCWRQALQGNKDLSESYGMPPVFGFTTHGSMFYKRGTELECLHVKHMNLLYQLDSSEVNEVRRVCLSSLHLSHELGV